MAALAALSMSAQTSLVKEVERGVKNNGDSEQLLQKIQPALTNPETAELAETWVVAGKAGMGFYLDATLAQSLGQPFDEEKQNRAVKGLIDGFNYYLTALPLDTVTDAKGKQKTKYSKEIVKTIKERSEQLRNAAIMSWGAKDYQRAYDAWELYLSLPTNPVLGKNAPVAASDTIIGETMWNQAIAMLLLNKNAEALAKIEAMTPYGYFPDDYYDYGMRAAQATDNTEKANEFARRGMATPGGAGNTGFIAQLINTELNKKNYEAAYKIGQDALNNTSADQAELRAQLFDILGTIEEQADKIDEAKANFKKSFETDPTYGKAYYDYARLIYNNAISIDETCQTEKERTEKVNPILLDSAKYFEKAYELDEELTAIPNILYRLYYRLGAGYEDKANYWHNL